MGWKDTFVNTAAPGFLGGITTRRWLRLLVQNGFKVSPAYLLRAAATTFQAPTNSAFKRLEDTRFGKQIEAARVTSPLFVLGHYRSGTTHLQQLLATDPRLATPTLYQVFFPHTFLTTESINGRTFGFFIPERRFMDNVAQHINMPHEDEIAVCSMSGNTPFLSMSFPHRASHYDRFLTFRNASAAETQHWRDDIDLFLRKVTVRYQLPLLLKSPPHTGRIRILLEMYPDAKFVHVHRNPYDVYQSMRRLIDTCLPATSLQNAQQMDRHERAIRIYREMHEAYFDERSLIPSNRLCEVAYADLDKDPLCVLRHVYEALDLGDFGPVEPPLQTYLATLTGYQKNAFPNLPDKVRNQIRSEWQQSFDLWQYE